MRKFLASCHVISTSDCARWDRLLSCLSALTCPKKENLEIPLPCSLLRSTSDALLDVDANGSHGFEYRFDAAASH